MDYLMVKAQKVFRDQTFNFLVALQGEVQQGIELIQKGIPPTNPGFNKNVLLDLLPYARTR